MDSRDLEQGEGEDVERRRRRNPSIVSYSEWKDMGEI